MKLDGNPVVWTVHKENHVMHMQTYGLWSMHQIQHVAVCCGHIYRALLFSHDRLPAFTIKVDTLFDTIGIYVGLRLFVSWDFLLCVANDKREGKTRKS